MAKKGNALEGMTNKASVGKHKAGKIDHKALLKKNKPEVTIKPAKLEMGKGKKRGKA